MKCCFVDCETTGTSPGEHAMIQLAGALFVDAAKVEEFNFLIRPFPESAIEKEALEVNGRTEAEIWIYPEPQVVYAQFTTLLGRHCDKFDRMDKIHMVGYNGNFDADFIRAFFEKNNDAYFGSFFYWPIIDVATLAGLRLMTRRHQLRDFKLGTVAKALGVEVDGAAHDAMTDIKLTMRLFKKLTHDLALFEWERHEAKETAQ